MIAFAHADYLVIAIAVYALFYAVLFITDRKDGDE